MEANFGLVGFAFDRVFDQDSQQQDIFDWGVKGIVEGQSACPSFSFEHKLMGRCHDWI